MQFSAVAIAVGTLCRGLRPPRCAGSYYVQPVLVRVRRWRPAAA
jgi:hypothetical protein